MFVSSEHYLNVAKLTTFPAVYFALFLFICAFALVDRGLEFLRAFTKERRNNRISDADLKTKVLATQEIGLVKKLQTSYIRKCLIRVLTQFNPIIVIYRYWLRILSRKGSV